MQLACSLRVATADPAALPPDLKAAELDRRIEALADGARPLAASLGSSGRGLPDRRRRGAALQQQQADQPGAARRRRRPARRPADEDRRRRPSRSTWPSATSSSRAPDVEERRILGEYLGAAHRPARGGLPTARLGPADLARVPIQPLNPTASRSQPWTRRSASHGRETSPTLLRLARTRPRPPRVPRHDGRRRGRVRGGHDGARRPQGPGGGRAS